MSGPGTLRNRSVVAVLAPGWPNRDEATWVARQVAGALATQAEIHIVTPGGVAEVTHDSIFIVHRLGSGDDRRSTRIRDLVLEGLDATDFDRGVPLPTDTADLLASTLAEPWAGADSVLAGLNPDRVVVVDTRNLGALGAIEAGAPDAPVSVVALDGGSARHGWRHFAPVVDRADGILAVTEGERDRLVERFGNATPVHCTGVPMAANPSVRTEPNPWVGDSGYLLILAGVASGDDDPRNELVRLLRLGCSDQPVGIVHSDAFHVWHGGRLETGWPVERSSDLARLMAWARVTVDVRIPPLFGRDCVTSLLHGTPVVVPAGSPAEEHARAGGGLWFSSPSELLWCVESLLDPDTASRFGSQGRAYAEACFGSTDRFVAAVLAACPLPDAPVRAGVVTTRGSMLTVAG